MTTTLIGFAVLLVLLLSGLPIALTTSPRSSVCDSSPVDTFHTWMVVPLWSLQTAASS